MQHAFISPLTASLAYEVLLRARILTLVPDLRTELITQNILIMVLLEAVIEFHQ